MAQTNCTPMASGLVSWWRGEGDAADQLGGNNGTLGGQTTYLAGKVGQGFLFDGVNDGITVGNAVNLQLQDFTIEAWIRRSSTSLISASPTDDAIFFGFGHNGYVFGLQSSANQLLLSKNDVDSLVAGPGINDTNYHHVAMTKSGSSVVFYVDGVGYPAPTYTSVFSFTTPAALGARGDTLAHSFRGLVDDLAIYNRALTATELQSIYGAGASGKCQPQVAPTIVSQPANQTAAVGGTATFSVGSTGTSPLGYQWTFNGADLTNATNASLVLTGVVTNQAGNYSVVVSNQYGVATSSNAALAILDLGTTFFDDFEPNIDLPQWAAFGGTVLATNYGGSVSGTSSLWFGGTGSRFATTRVLNTTSGGTISFYLRIANGTFPWENADLPGEGVVIEYDVLPGTNWVQIGRYDTSAYWNWTNISSSIPVGAQGSSVQFRWRQLANSGSMSDHWALDNVMISTGPTGPAISTQPQSQSVVLGENATFNVGASGTAPLTYQWQHAGTNLPGATTSTLAFASAQYSDAGAYNVIVSNSINSISSSNAILTVTAPQTNCTLAASGLVSWWRAETNGLDQAGIYNGTLAGNTTYGTGKTGKAFVFDGVSDGVTLGTAPSLQLQNFTIEAWIRRTSLTLISSSASADAIFFGYGHAGYVLGLDHTSKQLLLSKNDIDGLVAGPAITDTNYHHVALAKSGTNVVFYVDGAGYTAPPYTSTFEFGTVAAIGARGDTLAHTFRGMIDELAIYNRALSGSEVQAIFDAGAAGKCVVSTPVSIVTQPTNQLAVVGSTATLTVVASGSPPLSYQWSFNGTNISGATTNALRLTNVQLNQSGNYAVVVSNPLGPVGSSNAVLTVLVAAPTIVAQPEDRTVFAGDSASFNVSATGTEPLTYQWQLNGSAITGATGAFLTVSNAQQGDAGSYSVIVTNAAGSAGSSNAVLTVLPVPTNCISPAPGLISWWRGEGDAADQLGGNNGTLGGQTTYLAGKVGQGFLFDGVNDGITVGNAINLQLQDFTIEAWIRRSSTSLISASPTDDAIFFGFGHNGYVFGLQSSANQLLLSKNDVDSLVAGPGINDTNYHHVAMTKSGSSVVFYVDGVGYPAPTYTSVFSFTTPAALGARGDTLAHSFRGLVDDLAIYDGALSASSIQSIYLAGYAGKCVIQVPPSIVSQPQDQTVLEGGSASFSVNSSGTQPLSYQWQLNGSPLNGRTASGLLLTNIQSGQAGSYSVLVSNVAGWASSSNAILTVLAGQTNCAPSPSGLVSWWRGEGNAQDQLGGNGGTLAGNATYGQGVIGQGFVFDGVNDGVLVGSAPSLQLQDFTIEAWIRRTSLTLMSTYSSDDAIFFGYGHNGYVFGLEHTSKQLLLSKNDVDALVAGPAITDTNFHHVAVTKSGSNVVFYVDGIGYQAPTYTSTFSFGTPAAVGARGDTLAHAFRGAIDDLAIYNRALTATEIQSVYLAAGAGKCLIGVPPTIDSQPHDHTVFKGGSANFSVSTSGTQPLTYQWQLNGSPLNGQTGSSLQLTNIQSGQAGSYSVLVSNIAGWASSSNALLTVVPVPTNCIPPVSGLISWWRGENNTYDQLGGNDGTAAGNTTFGAGVVGQGFVFDGVNDGVLVGSAPSLQLQDFTIEAWIRRTSPTLMSTYASDDAIFFGYGHNGYVFGLEHTSNQLLLSKNDVDALVAGPAITDTNFHHVAVTKSGSAVVFYVDGIGYQAPTYTSTFSFGTPAAVGARGDTLAHAFRGAIDDLAIYNRALTATEVQGVYISGAAGKCVLSVAPAITSQPANRTVLSGGNTVFSATVSGSAPLSFQWRFNGNPIGGQTSSFLELNNVQSGDAGNYSVVVTNAAGSAQSNDGLLTVLDPPTNCVAIPSGIVSWWGADSNPLDQSSTNNGTLAGNTAYTAGIVGQAFIFDGNHDGVVVGSATNLQLQDFTIEAWIRRTSTNLLSTISSDDGIFFGYGYAGYVFGVDHTSKQLLLSKNDIDGLVAGPAITDTNFHHVAVAKLGTNVVFYVDGIGYQAPTYTSTFTFGTPAAVGARGDTLAHTFRGVIDDLAIYDRALTATEIAGIYTAGGAGKCLVGVAPTIVNQPVDRSVFTSGSASFMVVATGSAPLSYQWLFNGNPLGAQTRSTLTLTNVQAGDAGYYSIEVTNASGSALSSNAVLTVMPISTNCDQPPTGLLSWWRAEGDGADQLGINNGTTAGDTTFASAEVGQGFVLDGNGDAMLVGSAANLQLQDFSIEAWIRRTSTNLMSTYPGYDAIFFGFGSGGYVFGLQHDTKQLLLSKNDIDSLVAGPTITDTNFHHVAMTKSGSNVVFYVDGSGYPAPAYTSTFDFTSAAAVGARGDTLAHGFRGIIDELAIYDHALSGSEVGAIYAAGSAGKCIVTMAPSIVAAPTNQAVGVGGSLTFSVNAVGSGNLGYQWQFNGVNLTGQTDSTLAINGARTIDSGSYSVVVSNSAGATSANAVVQVQVTSEPSGQLFVPSAIPGGFLISFSGTPSQSYTILRATGITGPWFPIATISAGKSGIGSYFDTNAPSSAAFYRIVVP